MDAIARTAVGKVGSSGSWLLMQVKDNERAVMSKLDRRPNMPWPGDDDNNEDGSNSNDMDVHDLA